MGAMCVSIVILMTLLLVVCECDMGPENLISNGTHKHLVHYEGQGNRIYKRKMVDLHHNETPQNKITNGTIVDDDETPNNSIIIGTLVDDDEAPHNIITNGTLVDDDETQENTITNATLVEDNETSKNATINGTLVDDDETSENAITNGTLVNADETSKNATTNGTLMDDDKTPENAITNATLVNDNETPENRITNATLVDDNETPENRITNATLVEDNETPENGITNATFVDDNEIPENRISNATLVDDIETSENRITNATLVDDIETSENRINIATLVEDSETPENRIKNATLVDDNETSENRINNVNLVVYSETRENALFNGTDLSPDETQENRIFNEPVVRLAQDGGPQYRIFDGTLAHPGQFPFLVYVRTGAKDPEYCGGVILTIYWVLTPAHCVLPAVFMNLNVTAGIVSFNSSVKSSSVRKVRKLLIHPEFVEKPPGRFHHNVAILKLMSPFYISFEIRLARLAAKNSWPVSHREECFIIGWGMGNQADDNKMNFQRINVMGMTQCTDKEQFRQTLCTVSKAGFGPCMNDIGAPLWCQTAVVGMLVATLNESAECGADQVVHVYEFTGDQVEWISGVVTDLPEPIKLMTDNNCATSFKDTSRLMCTVLLVRFVYTLL